MSLQHPIALCCPAPPCPSLPPKSAVLDCMFNSELLARCADYRPLKMFLIQLSLGKAEQQVWRDVQHPTTSLLLPAAWGAPVLTAQRHSLHMCIHAARL